MHGIRGIRSRRLGHRWSAAAAIVLMMSTLVPALHAQNQRTDAVGGSAGSGPTDKLCPAGQALVGIHGRAGDWWDRLTGDCQLLNADGSSAGAFGTTPNLGGNGGVVSPSKRCPAGRVVAGLRVTGQMVNPPIGVFVTGLKIRCEKLGTDGETFGTPIELEVIEMTNEGQKPIGPTEGTAIHCSNNLPARGIYGWEGLYVDKIGLVCGPIDISAPSIASLTLNRDFVVGGSSATATVTLSRSVPSSGASVDIQPLLAGASATPDPLVITSGSSGTFRINTVPVALPATIAVSTQLNGGTRRDSLRIDPPSPASLTISPPSVTGGKEITGSVTLNGAAPAGLVVTVSHNNQAAISTPSPLMAACSGGTICPFTVNTNLVSANKTVTFLAGTRSATATVLAPQMASLTVSPSFATPGTQVTATATLTGNVPQGGLDGNSSVAFASSNVAAATVPTFAIVAGLNNIAAVPVTVGKPVAAACVSIAGSFNGTSRSAFLGVAPSQSNDISLTFPSVTVTAGQTVTGTVRASFNGAATVTATRGATLSTNSLLLVAGQPAAFTVTAGSEGCMMVTVSSGNSQRSVMLVSTFVIGG